MTTGSIRDLLLALGQSISNDTNRRARISTHPSNGQSRVFCTPPELFSQQWPPANSPSARDPNTIAKQQLRRAYGVLLQGPLSAATDGDEDDVIEELRFAQFEMAHNDMQNSEQLGACIALLQKEHGKDGVDDCVLRMLLNLRNAVPPIRPASPQSKVFAKLNPSAWTSNNCYTNVLHQYLNGNGSASMPSFFDIPLLRNQQHKCNPYEVRSHYGTNTKLQKTSPNPHAAQKNAAHINRSTTINHPKSSSQSHGFDRIHIKGYSWDYVSTTLDRHRNELRFASESSESLPHLLHQQQAGETSAVASVAASQLNITALIGAIKLLLVGTPNVAFTFDDRLIRFSIVPGICVTDCTAPTTAAICAPFIECGTCCARLRMMCDRDGNFGHRFEGFVFRVR